MDSTDIIIIVALLILICCSAWCSSTETAYSSVNKVRLRNRAENGDKKAVRALEFLEQYDKLLSCILIANNIVNLTAATLGTVLFTRLIPQYGPVLSTIVLTVLVLIFGEITPKTLAKEQAESFVVRAVPVLGVCLVILTPLHIFFGVWHRLMVRIISRFIKSEKEEGITEEELITMVEEAENEGGLEHRESELIRAAIEFDDLEVEEVLTPRVDVVAVEDTASNDELARVFAESGYSRIPVYEGSIDKIIGVVHEKDFYSALYQKREDFSIRDIMSEVGRTTSSAKISLVLQNLQHAKMHLAVVVDEYGGTMGIITLEDILEELVGEIWDEHDEIVEEFKEQEDGSFLIDCSAGLDDVFERFGLRWDDDIDAASIGGWVQDQLGRLPAEGDSFQYENLMVTVTRIENLRVMEIHAKIVPVEEEDA